MFVKANTHALWWWILVGVSTFAKEVEFLGLRGVWVPLSLPPGFGAFEKIKCIFSIAPVENFTHQTQCVEAPDAGL